VISGPTLPAPARPQEQTETVKCSEGWYKLWSARLGTQDRNLLRRTLRTAHGMDTDKPRDSHLNVLTIAHDRRLPHKGRLDVAEGPLHILDMDVFQPRWQELPHTQEGTVLAMRYVLVVVDRYSRMPWSYFCKHKHELPELLSLFVDEVGITRIHAATFFLSSGKDPRVHTDNDAVLTAPEAQSILRKAGFVGTVTSSPGNPAMNGIAERMIGTLQADARARILASTLPMKFWHWAWWHATMARRFVASQLCRYAPTGDFLYLTPAQLFFGYPPDLHRQVVFGAPCAYIKEGQTPGKFDAVSRPGYVLGYAGYGIQWQQQVRFILGYLILDANKTSLAFSRSVRINETGIVGNYVDTLPSLVPGSDGPEPRKDAPGAGSRGKDDEYPRHNSSTPSPRHGGDLQSDRDGGASQSPRDGKARSARDVASQSPRDGEARSARDVAQPAEEGLATLEHQSQGRATQEAPLRGRVNPGVAHDSREDRKSVGGPQSPWRGRVIGCAEDVPALRDREGRLSGQGKNPRSPDEHRAGAPVAVAHESETRMGHLPSPGLTTAPGEGPGMRDAEPHDITQIAGPAHSRVTAPDPPTDLLALPEGFAAPEVEHRPHYEYEVMIEGTDSEISLPPLPDAQDIADETALELDLAYDPQRRDRAVRSTTRRQVYANIVAVGGHENARIYAAAARKVLNGKEVAIPATYREARLLPEWPFWWEACIAQIKQYIKLKAFEEMLVPDTYRCFKSKWVFAAKSDDFSGEITGWRARVALAGYSQKYQVHFWETFSPTTRPEQVRIALALAAAAFGEIDSSLIQNVSVRLMAKIDVKEAYLNSELPEEEQIYVDVFPEWPTELKAPPGYKVALRTRKAIPGLKQSGRRWWKTLLEFLLSHGWEQCKCAPCVFRRGAGNGWAILVVFVDDGLVAQLGPPTGFVEQFIEEMQERFTVKVDYTVSSFLGMELSTTQEGIVLHFNKYITDLAARHPIGSRTSAVPASATVHPNTPQFQDELDDDARRSYQELVGSLMYCMVHCRLDIAYAVSVLASRMSNPRRADWIDALQTLRYLFYRRSRGILFRYKPERKGLHAYVDSDWAGDKESRRSRTGWILIYNGAPISWYSGLQRIVALSSTEAEYIAVSTVACEIKYARQLLTFLGEGEESPTPVGEDNRGAIEWAKNEIDHKRTKHIDVRYHFVRELVESNLLRIYKEGTDDNRADPFTKPVTHAVFERHMCALMVDIESLSANELEAFAAHFSSTIAARRGVSGPRPCEG